MTPQLLNAILYELTLDSKYLEEECSRVREGYHEMGSPVSRPPEKCAHPTADAVYHSGLHTAAIV